VIVFFGGGEKGGGRKKCHSPLQISHISHLKAYKAEKKLVYPRPTRMQFSKALRNFLIILMNSLSLYQNQYLSGDLGGNRSLNYWLGEIVEIKYPLALR
jgi:hypothetical protein